MIYVHDYNLGVAGSLPSFSGSFDRPNLSIPASTIVPVMSYGSQNARSHKQDQYTLPLKRQS